MLVVYFEQQYPEHLAAVPGNEKMDGNGLCWTVRRGLEDEDRVVTKESTNPDDTCTPEQFSTLFECELVNQKDPFELKRRSVCSTCIANTDHFHIAAVPEFYDLDRVRIHHLVRCKMCDRDSVMLRDSEEVMKNGIDS